jgi:hypothetical protein
MKKLLITIALVLLSTLAFGQSRVANTNDINFSAAVYDEIRQDADRNYDLFDIVIRTLPEEYQGAKSAMICDWTDYLIIEVVYEGTSVRFTRWLKPGSEVRTLPSLSGVPTIVLCAQHP